MSLSVSVLPQIFTSLTVPATKLHLVVILAPTTVPVFILHFEYMKSGLLIVYPATDELLVEFLGNVEKQVEIGGYMQWGYSESRFLTVDSLKSL